MLDAMQAWGAPQHEIDALQARLAAAPPEADDFGVHADNWQAVMVFCQLGARWQYAGIEGRRTGMDWAGVEAWLDRHLRPRLRRPLSIALQLMERAVLAADQELRAQKHNNQGE